MTKRAALILAGGKGRRFQSKNDEWQDKALAELLGKPMLVHVVENACNVADEVVVCVNDETRIAGYAQALKRHKLSDIRFVVDEKISHISGPNVAIMTGLKSVHSDFCITLPCDTPLIKPAIIEYLFNAGEDAQVSVPMWPNGRLETLVMVLERNSAAEIAETLCCLRRPRSDDVVRGASEVLFVSPMGEMKHLDPELQSFVNINHSEDLAILQIRPAHGNITADFTVNLGTVVVPELQRLRDTYALLHEHELAEASAIFSSCASELEKHKSPFWAGISREKEGETLLTWSQHQKKREQAAELDFKGKDAFLAAAGNYETEAQMHLQNRCRFLAERAWADKAWCESKVMGKTDRGERFLAEHK
jgi:molybdopterin-guanine dinucleotide biosynthesis protein A